jgi:hypothetical protein
MTLADGLFAVGYGLLALAIVLWSKNQLLPVLSQASRQQQAKKVRRLSPSQKHLKQIFDLSPQELKWLYLATLHQKEQDNYKGRWPYVDRMWAEQHECYDGSGLPSGLKGDDISDLSYLLMLNQYLDAGLNKETIADDFLSLSGTQLPPEWVRLMIESLNAHD